MNESDPRSDEHYLNPWPLRYRCIAQLTELTSQLGAIHHFTGLSGTNIMTSSRLLEHCTGIAEVMGSNPVHAWIVFRSYFHYCSSSAHYCDHHFHSQASDNLNKFERTFRWKFCGNFWLPDILSILERTWLQGI